MADQKISAMTAASSVADADITPIVQGGTNKKSAFSVIKAYIQAAFDAIYVPLSRVLTIDGIAHDLSTDRSWTSGGVPTARTLTIGGTSHDLSADRSWTTTQILDGIDTPSQGDILIRSNSNWIVLNPSVDGEVLTTHGTSSNPTWTAIPGSAGTQANGSADTPGAIVQSGAVTYGSNLTPWVDPANGDFRINLTAANWAGRGAFTETASSYAGTVGFPDIGAAQSKTGSGGTFSKEVSYGFNG